MDKIKEDENRVDIATLNSDDIEGDDLTGGYIFQIDTISRVWWGCGWMGGVVFVY